MTEAKQTNEPAKQAVPEFRVFQHDKPAMALGLAVNHLMNKPAFAKLPFGEWSQILVGQINRKHYYFVLDANNKIVGFAGRALASKEHAEAWAEGRRPLSYEDSIAGDCMVCNAWSANATHVHRWMFREANNVWAGKRLVYFRRFYPDGRVRPARINVAKSWEGKAREGEPGR